MRRAFYLYSVNSNMIWSKRGWTSEIVEAYEFHDSGEAAKVAEDMGAPECLYLILEKIASVAT